MARRPESVFASAALAGLFCLTLFYGCRAFDPEPVVVNRPPETFIVGASAETTGSAFRRHLFWYGTDRDGEVVRYIFAVTDSIARNIRRPDTDEEDALFDPGDDITTLTPTDRRTVGWTTRTDSLFVIPVGLGAVQTKEVTFHIVAVDDRGAVDPTPARLRFFNNSLGNPVVYFSLYADNAPAGSAEPQWELRWVGTPTGGPLRQPIPELGLPVSPEQTSQPFTGFNRRFRIDWVGDSPNGAIVGYRSKSAQGIGSFTPGLDVKGRKQFSPTQTSFTYANAVDPATIGGACAPDPVTASVRGCPPETVRFYSGGYLLEVEAVDVAQVETNTSAEALTFQVNYAPETTIDRGSEYPRYRVLGTGGAVLASGVFSEGDTIPAGSQVTFRTRAYDRVASALPPGSLLCCDERLNPAFPEVRFQSRINTLRRGVNGVFELSNEYQGTPLLDSLITFEVAELDYEFRARSVDEHRRVDTTPDILRFVGGFQPKITQIYPGRPIPTTNPAVDWPDTLVFANPFVPWRWAMNEITYESAGTLVTRAFAPNPDNCGGNYFDRPAGDGEVTVQGTFFRYRPRFVGKGDARDPKSRIRAWTYSIASENDPENRIEEGPGENRSLTNFTDVTTEDRWEFSGANEAFQIFVPLGLWIGQEDQYEPSNNASSVLAKQGCVLLRQLEEMTLRVVGRTTNRDTKYTIYANTTAGSGAIVAEFDGEDYDRRTEVAETRFVVLLGLGNQVNPNDRPTRLWPDF